MKAERTRRLTGTSKVDGRAFDCNESATAGATFAAFMADVAGGDAAAAYRQPWVLADNTMANLTAKEMITVGMAGKVYVTALWATSQDLRDLIDAATTADEVAAVTSPR